MCKLCLNQIPKSFSVCASVRERMFFGLLLILFCVLTVKPISGEVANTSTILDTPLETLKEKKIVKIEYFIDNNSVTDNKTLNSLEKSTYIAVGSQFSRHAIQQSVISLYSLQQYSQVDVYALKTPEGVALNFQLHNVMHIQKINITGIPSDELRRAIRTAIKLEPGAMYIPIIAKKDIDSIKGVCAENGYFNVDVAVKAIPSDRSLTYQINLRKPTSITKLRILGNTAIFTENIKEICRADIGKVYRKSDVDEDISAIRELYQKKYYPNVEILPDFAHTTGVLTFNINEGIQLLLDFVDQNGRPIFQDSPVRNLFAKLDIIKQERERDQLRDEIASIMDKRPFWTETVEDYFAAKGYDGTKVDWKILTNSPLHVKFTITLGPRYIVRNVKFTGNKAFSAEELLQEMETKPANFFSRRIRRRFFSEQALTRDTQRLKILYEKAGYPKLTIKKTDIIKQNINKRNVGEISINLTFVEPYKEVIFHCHFSGNSVLNATTLYEVLPSKPPVPNARLVKKNFENAILKTYQDRGYIDVTVETQYLNKMDDPVFLLEGNYSELLDVGVLPKELSDVFEKHKLSLTGTFIATKIGDEWSMQDIDGNARYTLKQEKEYLAVFEHGVLLFEVNEGDQIAFGKFFFDGDTGVNSNVLKREVAHLEDTLYTQDKLSGAIQNLYNTGIFELGIRPERRIPTDIEEQPSNPVVNDVLIRLQKRKPRAIGASVGYGSSDGPRGTIALSHYNLFKRNVRFRLRGRQGTLGYLYDTTLTEPWFIGRISGSLQFLGRKLEEDDGVRALQGSFSLSRKLSRAHRLNLEYSYRDLKDTSVAFSETTVSSLRALWRQDTRAPSLNPTSGMLKEATFEYAGGPLLGGESSFIKAVGDIRYHRKLNEWGLVLGTALRFGITTGLQTDRGAELISFERFWAGGSTTVRGYEERGLGPKDSTGKHRGNVQFIFNTELSFPIFNPIQGVLFFDTGNVWDTIENIEYEWLPATVGAGLRLNFGPLKLGVDYAAPLISIPDVPTNSFYFRIGSTF